MVRRKRLYIIQLIIGVILFACSVYISSLNKRMALLHAEPMSYTRGIYYSINFLFVFNVLLAVYRWIDRIDKVKMRHIFFGIFGLIMVLFLAISSYFFYYYAIAFEDRKVDINGKEMVETREHDGRRRQDYFSYSYPVNFLYKTRYGQTLEELLESLNEKYGLSFVGDIIETEGFEQTFEVSTLEYPHITMEFSNQYSADPDGLYRYHNAIVNEQIEEFINERSIAWSVSGELRISIVEDDDMRYNLIELCGYLRERIVVEEYRYSIYIESPEGKFYINIDFMSEEDIVI